MTIALVLLFASVAAAGERVWTSSDGRTMRGEFVRELDGEVTFLVAGKLVTIPLERLSESDQKKVRDLAAGKDVPDDAPAATGAESTDSSREGAAKAEAAGDPFGNVPEKSPDAEKPAGVPSLTRKPRTITARLWTDNQGRQSTAKFVRMFGGDVVLSRGNKPITVDFFDLSAADQQYVRDLLTERGEEDQIPTEPLPETATEPADEQSGVGANQPQAVAEPGGEVGSGPIGGPGRARGPGMGGPGRVGGPGRLGGPDRVGGPGRRPGRPGGAGGIPWPGEGSGGDVAGGPSGSNPPPPFTGVSPSSVPYPGSGPLGANPGGNAVTSGPGYPPMPGAADAQFGPPGYNAAPRHQVHTESLSHGDPTTLPTYQRVPMCSNCRKQVSESEAQGTSCPHCGARWLFNQYSGADGTATAGKSGIQLLPMSGADAERTVKSVVLIAVVMGVVVLLVGGIIAIAVAIASASRPSRQYRPLR